MGIAWDRDSKSYQRIKNRYKNKRLEAFTTINAEHNLCLPKEWLEAEAEAYGRQARQDLALAQAQAQLEELQAKANKYNAQASVQEASAQVLQAEANALESTPHKGEQNESKALNHAQKLMQFNPKKAAADMR